MKILCCAVSAILACLSLSARCESYALLRKNVAPASGGGLAGAQGMVEWTDAAAKQVMGLGALRLKDGQVSGSLGKEPARAMVKFATPGADLDLGFNDFIDLELQLPAGFDGKVSLDFETAGKHRIEIPSQALSSTGTLVTHRLDVGLVPHWRGFLTAIELVIEAGSSSGNVTFGKILVGDRPGDVVEPNLQLNLKEGMKIEDLKKVESKHGCIWWQESHEKEGFDPKVMPRRALRMLEETWQIAVNQLGYRDPCLGINEPSKRRRKINHITWHGGFWMSGGDPPHFNVPAPGLLDEGWGNPVPHEFAHTVQAGQLNFLNGCHWESHANYIRFCRNLHFKDFSGLDTLDYGVLMRSNYYQDHPRLIYADYRPYFYLDNDPDQLGLPAGLSAILWKTGKKDEFLWDRLPSVLPAGVTRETVVAGIARSWLTFAFHGGKHIHDSHFGPDAEGQLRWYRYMSPLEPVADKPGTYAVPLAKAPMKFAWCFHEIQATGAAVEATLAGVDLQGPDEDWRWGFVALDKDGSYQASEIFKPGTGRFQVPAGHAKLLIYVAATPANSTLRYLRPTPETGVDRHPEYRRYPYEISFRNAAPAKRELPCEAPAGKLHPNGGGFVADSATVEATAFVGPQAKVLGSAKVLGNSRILDHAVVRGAAEIRDEVEISGHSVIQGEARIRDAARVRGHAFVGGRVQLRDRARAADLVDLQESMEISGDAWVRGISAPLQDTKASGYAILDADYAMAFSLQDGVHFHHIPWGGWYFDEVAAKLSKPRGLVASYRFLETDGTQALDEFGALVATIRGQPQRVKGELQLKGGDQYVILDPSITDAPAATWMLRTRLTHSKAQPLFSINSLTDGGMVMGVNTSGQWVAALSIAGKDPLIMTSKSKARIDEAVSVTLRVDGKTASLLINGRPVASQAWPHPACGWFRDVGNQKPSQAYLGRDAKGVGNPCVLLGFKAFNVALKDEEVVEIDPFLRN
jgi:hypothetical protein